MKMKDLQAEMTLANCVELKNMIVQNPELPLLIFVGEEAWEDNGAYNSVKPVTPYIEELTICEKLDRWMDKVEYEDYLRVVLAQYEEFNMLSDEEFDAEVEKQMQQTAFMKAITIWVG